MQTASIHSSKLSTSSEQQTQNKKYSVGSDSIFHSNDEKSQLARKQDSYSSQFTDLGKEIASRIQERAQIDNEDEAQQFDLHTIEEEEDDMVHEEEDEDQATTDNQRKKGKPQKDQQIKMIINTDRRKKGIEQNQNQEIPSHNQQQGQDNIISQQLQNKKCQPLQQEKLLNNNEGIKTVKGLNINTEQLQNHSISQLEKREKDGITKKVDKRNNNQENEKILESGANSKEAQSTLEKREINKLLKMHSRSSEEELARGWETNNERVANIIAKKKETLIAEAKKGTQLSSQQRTSQPIQQKDDLSSKQKNKQSVKQLIQKLGSEDVMGIAQTNVFDFIKAATPNFKNKQTNYHSPSNSSINSQLQNSNINNQKQQLFQHYPTYFDSLKAKQEEKRALSPQNFPVQALKQVDQQTIKPNKKDNFISSNSNSSNNKQTTLEQQPISNQSAPYIPQELMYQSNQQLLSTPHSQQQQPSQHIQQNYSFKHQQISGNSQEERFQKLKELQQEKLKNEKVKYSREQKELKEKLKNAKNNSNVPYNGLPVSSASHVSTSTTFNNYACPYCNNGNLCIHCSSNEYYLTNLKAYHGNNSNQIYSQNNSSIGSVCCDDNQSKGYLSSFLKKKKQLSLSNLNCKVQQSPISQKEKSREIFRKKESSSHKSPHSRSPQPLSIELVKKITFELNSSEQRKNFEAIQPSTEKEVKMLVQSGQVAEAINKMLMQSKISPQRSLRQQPKSAPSNRVQKLRDGENKEYQKGFTFEEAEQKQIKIIKSSTQSAVSNLSQLKDCIQNKRQKSFKSFLQQDDNGDSNMREQKQFEVKVIQDQINKNLEQNEYLQKDPRIAHNSGLIQKFPRKMNSGSSIQLRTLLD